MADATPVEFLERKYNRYDRERWYASQCDSPARYGDGSAHRAGLYTIKQKGMVCEDCDRGDREGSTYGCYLRSAGNARVWTDESRRNLEDHFGKMDFDLSWRLPCPA